MFDAAKFQRSLEYHTINVRVTLEALRSVSPAAKHLLLERKTRAWLDAEHQRATAQTSREKIKLPSLADLQQFEAPVLN